MHISIRSILIESQICRHRYSDVVNEAFLALRLKAAVRLAALTGLAPPECLHMPRSMAQSSLAFMLQKIASYLKGADG